MEKTSRARAKMTRMASLGRMVVPDIRIRGEKRWLLLSSIELLELEAPSETVSEVAFFPPIASSEPINSSDWKAKKRWNASRKYSFWATVVRALGVHSGVEWTPECTPICWSEPEVALRKFCWSAEWSATLQKICRSSNWSASLHFALQHGKFQVFI